MTSAIIEDRAAVAAQASARTLCELLAATAARHGDLPAYSDRDETGGWQTLTWQQVRDQVLTLAAALVRLGLQPRERVALMLPNRTEHVLADLAVVHAGGVPVTFYATIAPDQIKYLATDCDVRFAVLDGASELARWQPLLPDLPGLAKVIVRDAAACPADERHLSWAGLIAVGEAAGEAGQEQVSGRVTALGPDDPVTLLYTSGTTGNPKGVVITHGSVLYECATAKIGGTLAEHGRSVSYLPLAHIAERMLTIYLVIFSASHSYFCRATTDLIRTVGEVKPTAFYGVPRVWEKVQAGIRALLAAEQDDAKRAAVAAAMDAGRRYVESSQYGHATSPELAEEFAAAEAAVLRPIKSLLGLDETAVVVSMAAPLPPEVGGFFAGLGMKMLDVYGMTETTGAFATNTPAAFKLGTVGRPVPGIEVKIAQDGEILARGPLNTPGYWNLPGQTAELIDRDGWLHTGDIGSIDADGFLAVVDRKKELIITSGGENISPAAIEGALVAHPLVGQALAFGDRRKYVVALLALDGEVAPAWARARGIEAASLAELAEHPAVLDAVADAIAQANESLARVQQVKRWRLLPVEWTAESEELTPTLKLKRRVIHRKYADVIDSLYAEGD